MPIGVGNIVGSRLGGLYADWTVAKWIAKRGYRRPEDRLYSTLVGGGLLVPGSMIAVGWLTETAKGGLAPVLVFVSNTERSVDFRSFLLLLKFAPVISSWTVLHQRPWPHVCAQQLKHLLRRLSPYVVSLY